MGRKERFEGVLDYFRKNVPLAQTELSFGSPFQLLAAVILSAQCTDKRVNMVTPELFRAMPTPEIMSKASVEDILRYISSVSYPNSKALHLQGMARKLISDFGGEVPSEIDALQSLPGVGRKTANVVASIVYDKPVIAVDTHVLRVSHRLGLSDGKTPEAVERDLEANIPVEDRARSHHWLILHGRYICTARSPKCSSCPLTMWCREFERNESSK